MPISNLAQKTKKCLPKTSYTQKNFMIYFMSKNWENYKFPHFDCISCNSAFFDTLNAGSNIFIWLFLTLFFKLHGRSRKILENGFYLK
jgi:hypothetical protein